MSYQDAADYSAQHEGKALVIAVDGQVALESYANGGDPDVASYTHSAAKGYWGAVARAMVADGHWSSLDDKVADYMSNWDKPRFRDISLRELCWLVSGLIPDQVHIGGQGGQQVANYYDHVRDFPSGHSPYPLPRRRAAGFQYKPSDFYVLGEVIRETIGQTPLEYLQTRFFGPLGLVYQKWETRAGLPNMPNGCTITAKEWLKWAEFLRSDGGSLLSQSDMDDIKTGSSINPGHGLCLWLNTEGGFDNNGRSPVIYPGGHYDAFAGMGGMHGQSLCMGFPSLGLSLIRQAGQSPSFDIWTLIGEMLA